MTVNVNNNINILLSMTKTRLSKTRLVILFFISTTSLLATLLVSYGPASHGVKSWYYPLISFVCMQLVLYLFWWFLEVIQINNGGKSTIFALNCIKNQDWHWIQLNPFIRPTSIHPIVTNHPSFRYVIGCYLDKCDDTRAKAVLNDAIHDLNVGHDSIIETATQSVITDLIMPSSLKRIGVLFSIVYLFVSILIAVIVIVFVGFYFGG